MDLKVDDHFEFYELMAKAFKGSLTTDQQKVTNFLFFKKNYILLLSN